MQSRHPSPGLDTSTRRAPPLRALLLAVVLGAAAPAFAALGPAASHATSLPVAGLFQGDQLSDRAKARLDELIRGLQGSSVEVAVMVPTGPWVTGAAGRGERSLNQARMSALRAYLADRGIEPGRVFVEGGLEAHQPEPRLDVQLVTRPTR